MEKIKQKAIEILKTQKFDCFAVGVIDFNSNNFQSFEIENCQEVKASKYYFDLASVSKVLNLAACYLLHPKYFNEKMILLLEHRGSLPAWGLLDKSNWREVLMSYDIHEAPTLYSDYSALRLMLEIEQKSGSNLKELISGYWDSELLFWKDLNSSMFCPVTGFRLGNPITHEVHDPNAYVINEYTSHAGLFATIGGLCRSLINLNQETKFVSQMKDLSKLKKHPYYKGWDTVSDLENTLAGKGCSASTFGHLGFTGTSVWIDPVKNTGNVILSNATKNFWYDKDGLNHLRRTLGEMIWKL